MSNDETRKNDETRNPKQPSGSGLLSSFGIRHSTLTSESAQWNQATFWAMLLGLALRLFHYARNPAMWHDEGAPTANILHKTFAELWGKLEHYSTGPTLLLCLQKWLVQVLGDSIYIIRLPSFLAACIGLVIFARLAMRTLPASGAFCATLLIACSDRLLWHASEARHYSTDFLFAVLLLYIFTTTATWRLEKRIAVLAVFAPFAILFSYPGVFLCAGMMMALLPELRVLRRPSAWVAWLGLGVVVTAAFAVFYIYTIRVQRSPEMNAAWTKVFPDLHRPWILPVWAVFSTVSIFDYFVRPFAGGLLVIPATVGVVIFWKEKNHSLLLLILVPMACAMAAALVGSYPYTGARTMVYALPGLGLLIGAGLPAGVGWLWTRLPRPAACIALAVLCFPLGEALFFSLRGVVLPWKRPAADLASDYVLAHRFSTDLVAANDWEYDYYFRKLGADYHANHDFLYHPADVPTRHVWLVLTSGAYAMRDEMAKDILSRGWIAIDRQEYQNTTVWLLEKK